MTSSENVQNTRMSGQVKRLHLALMEIVSAMNRAQNDDALLAEAGIQLDRALFPLLVAIERFGPISVGELADRAGRDYTTVSRQLKKLSALGLVARASGEADQRVTVATVTPAGKQMTEALDRARERLARLALADWSEADLDRLVGLLERLTAAVRGGASAPAPE